MEGSYESRNSMINLKNNYEEKIGEPFMHK